MENYATQIHPWCSSILGQGESFFNCSFNCLFLLIVLNKVEDLIGLFFILYVINRANDLVSFFILIIQNVKLRWLLPQIDQEHDCCWHIQNNRKSHDKPPWIVGVECFHTGVLCRDQQAEKSSYKCAYIHTQMKNWADSWKSSQWHILLSQSDNTCW